jgi:GNAT superfamily N-acetyltransferase
MSEQHPSAMSKQSPVAPTATAKGDVPRIEVVDSPGDIAGMFACCAAAFGSQTNDPIWTGLNPDWDTSKGQERGTARMTSWWRTPNRSRQGDATTVFLKATVADGSDKSQRRVVGVGVWTQMSMVEGHGQMLEDDEAMRKRIELLYPDNNNEARFVYQMFRSLLQRRREIIKEKSTANPPAIMVLDLCAVDPAFQRIGIALKLVQWGLDEAKRRGGLEATTEASSMGRFVYTRLGFRPEGNGADIVYDVDNEFEWRRTPPNVFLRTGAS